jgi:hypothetical protein
MRLKVSALAFTVVNLARLQVRDSRVDALLLQRRHTVAGAGKTQDHLRNANGSFGIPASTHSLKWITSSADFSAISDATAA